MSNIFEIIDKTGRKVRLTSEQWSHIREFHENIENPEEIAETLEKPDKIIVDKREGIECFFKYFKHKKFKSKFLKVIVKYLNGDGFTISAHFVRSIK